MVQDRFWKNAFLTHLDPFLVLKQPIFKAFWDFPWPKTCHHGLKTGYEYLFEHPKWSTNNFGKKNHFFRPGTPVDPPLAPTVLGPGGPTAAPSDHFTDV